MSMFSLLLCFWKRVFSMTSTFSSQTSLKSLWPASFCTPRSNLPVTPGSSQRKAMSKNAQATTQLHSSHMLVKWCLKFSKPGFSNTWTMNFQMFMLVLEKAEEPEIKLPTSAGSWKKQKSSRKTSISASLVAQRLKHLHGMWAGQGRRPHPAADKPGHMSF